MVEQAAAPGAAFTTLSSNEVIQLLLADIPFFTVGILAFGTFTFFFLMKRVDRWVFCLHMSVILAFTAALLDLSQLLLQGRLSDGQLSTTTINGLDTAREVLYSFSNGLRFLFYWGFVAMIPAGETIPEGNNMHSGSWRRWGVMGSMLKWGTLLLVVVMIIFQIVFRTAASLHSINPVYEADAAFEVILSAVFILKLLLNTWARFPVGPATQSKGKMLVQYAPIIVALLFSMWIAVGNTILFEFTETALGRFMRAVEYYITIVYILTMSFHHLRHLSFFPIYRPATRSNTLRRGSTDKKSGDLFSPAAALEPVKVDVMQVIEDQYRTAQQMPQTVESDNTRSATVENANKHQSMAVRLSTWMGLAHPHPRPPQPNPQPWDVDAERGPSPTRPTSQSWNPAEKPPTDTLDVPSGPEIDEDEQRGVSPLPEYPPELPHVEEDVSSPISSIQETQQTDADSLTPVGSDQHAQQSTPVPDRDWQELEYSNAVRYSGVGDDIVAHALRQQQPYVRPERSPSMVSDIQVISPPPDDGSRRTTMEPDEYAPSPYPMSPLASAAATPQPRSRPLPPMPIPNRVSQLASPMTPGPDSARSSNMSILLRQQSELDQSIAALRNFSPTKQMVDATMSIYQAQESEEDEAAQMASVPRVDTPSSPELPLTTPGPDKLPASSVQSEFHFVHQPPLNRASMDSGVMPVPTPAFTQTDSVPASPFRDLAPPQIPVSRFSDVSSVSSRRDRKGVDSMGTQYDITSFVGNLTVPINPKDSVMTLSSNFSEEGSVGIATVARPGFVRPQLVSSNLARQNSLASSEPEAFVESISSPPPTARTTFGRALPPIPRPPSAESQSSSSPTGPPRFRRAVGLPPRPRLASVSHLTPVDERTSSSPSVLTASPLSGSGTSVVGKAL